MPRQLIWAVVLALVSFGSAQAQETTSGSITGQVVDAQGAAVPGATVSVTSAQGTKPFVTDSNGRFFAPFLTPGRYEVRVELTGFSPVEQKNIDVRLGQRLELDGLVLKVGGLEEVVEVVGAPPVIDTNSTTTGGILDTDALKRIPVGRNFTQTLYLVPGVSTTDVGNANPSVGGASGLENNYVVDGVNITNTGYGAVGSYSIVFGSLGTGVTTDFIKETQVKTGGFEAEYGQSTGGVVNVVTQSGTNALHGSVFGYFQPDSLESEFRQVALVNGAVNSQATQNADFGVSLGGPLVKDKVFFFGAFNPQFQRLTRTAPPDFALASLGDVDRKRKIYSYAGKLTWQADSNHRFDVSVFGDPAKGEMGPQRGSSLLRTTTGSFSELDYGGHNQILRYDGIISRNWLLEASVARATNSITETPSVNEWSVSDRTVSPNVISGGIGFYEQGNEGKNLQYQLKSTNLIGSHQIRYGVLVEDIQYNNINQTTGPIFTLPDGRQTATGATIQIVPDAANGRIYRVVGANLNSGRETQQRYMSFFLQDTWQVGKKLTVRPGLRYEQQRLRGSDNPALCHEDDSAPGLGDGTGPLTPCEVTWDGNWGPRLGIVFDPAGNGKAKLYANYGRFYGKIPNDLAARALSADAGVTRADYFDAALTRPVPEGTLAAGQTRHFILAGLHAAEFDPEAKSTFQEELVTGVEYELARGLNVGVRYLYRNMPRVLEDVGTVSLSSYFTDPSQAQTVEYFITNPTESTRVDVGEGRFEKPIHKYHAVEVTANKSFSDNWSLLTSYRWSRLSGTFEGFFRSDNGQSDPAISSLYDFPTNDPSYSRLASQFGFSGDIRFQGSLGQGPLPNDRTHQLKLYGNYTLSSLNLGAGINVGSGRPLTALASNPVYDNSGEIPEGPRGSGIQTRDDGFRERTPMQASVDLHADYAFKLGGQRRFTIIADVFNLTDRQEAANYDDATETNFGVLNPDFGAPVTTGVSPFPSYSLPRQIRLGARLEW
jgi:outer membrane receptor protein involved in Fe transport